MVEEAATATGFGRSIYGYNGNAPHRHEYDWMFLVSHTGVNEAVIVKNK